MKNPFIAFSDSPDTPKASQPSGFTENPERRYLDAEFHARPPIPLPGPTYVSHFVFLHDGIDYHGDQAHLDSFNLDGSWDMSESTDAYRWYSRAEVAMRYELHTEFSSYTFFLALSASGSNETFAPDATLRDWIAAIPGQLLVATNIELQSAEVVAPQQKIAEVSIAGNQTVVTQVVDGKGWIFTDFKIVDGASHFLLLNAGLSPRQAGRTVQRLWEIETYRVTALLGLPVAKAITARLRGAEEQLAAMMDQMCSSRSSDEECAVLDDLIQLAAEVEHSVARTTFRFSATRAYEAIVMQRISELREQRVEGFPTLFELMQRRLMPSVNTCAAMARRQDDLSARVARNSQLLRTRIDLALKRQNQLVLTQMNHRARLQLLLQETVEGLSVIAITYYGCQLVRYLAEGAGKLWSGLSPEYVTAASIPVIAITVALGLRSMRRQIANMPTPDQE